MINNGKETTDFLGISESDFYMGDIDSLCLQLELLMTYYEEMAKYGMRFKDYDASFDLVHIYAQTQIIRSMFHAHLPKKPFVKALDMEKEYIISMIATHDTRYKNLYRFDSNYYLNISKRCK